MLRVAGLQAVEPGSLHAVSKTLTPLGFAFFPSCGPQGVRAGPAGLRKAPPWAAHVRRTIAVITIVRPCGVGR